MSEKCLLLWDFARRCLILIMANFCQTLLEIQCLSAAPGILVVTQGE